jgi:transcriptional regulator with XRE-family HTH domain
MAKRKSLQDRLAELERDAKGRTLPDRLNEAFEARDLSAYAVAMKSGVKQSTISRIRSGDIQNPTGHTLFKLALALGVSLDWLCAGEGERDRGNPLATVTTLDIALHGLRADVSDRAAKLVMAWAEKTLANYSLKEWVAIILDVNRQVAEGVLVSKVKFPDPSEPLRVHLRVARDSEPSLPPAGGPPLLTAPKRKAG